MSIPAVTDTSSAVFPDYHRWDRAYHFVWIAMAWAAIIAGFGPNFYKKVIAGEKPATDCEH